MIETRVVVACVQCQVHWYGEHEPPGCSDWGHEHRRFEVHRHRTIVTLPDGTDVTAASFDPIDPYTRDRWPDFGLYLDHRWQPPWTYECLDWPDFGVPDDPARLVAVLSSALDRARAGEHVEIGCLGGHGRTGTALACLTILTGVPPGEAVPRVRAITCAKAVESVAQEAFVFELSV